MSKSQEKKSLVVIWRMGTQQLRGEGDPRAPDLCKSVGMKAVLLDWSMDTVRGVVRTRGFLFIVSHLPQYTFLIPG